MKAYAIGLLCGLCSVACSMVPAASPKTRIGSKKFTESVILAELGVQQIRAQGFGVSHQREIGSTQLVWRSLLQGSVDVYPEYTGTLRRELLAKELRANGGDLHAALKRRGLRMSRSLGFQNQYALGMRKKRALELGVRTISDLRRHPELRLGFTNEFKYRQDGWLGLKQHYGFSATQVLGLDHDVAYRSIREGAVDVIDVYTTDAEITYYDLVLLEDDQHYFEDYTAVWVYRTDWAQHFQGSLHALLSFEGRIMSEQMRRMNAQVQQYKQAETQVAQQFLRNTMGVTSLVATSESWLTRLGERTREHLFLVLVSLAFAIAVAIPLGVTAARYPKLGRAILAVVGIVQTIPSLALLVFMIPFLGIGSVPAMSALFLYGLLPIVRNTYMGLTQISPRLLESANALGLPALAKLRLVELPLAVPSIVAGIKTSAVINVGTATLGALIGAGGYGQPILSGIRMDHVPLILEGAIPAALMAMLVDAGFGLVERALKN